MKARLAKLESIVQGYVAKDSVSGENYLYLQENMETILYAIQQVSKVEEMQKTLEWYADKENYLLRNADEYDAGGFAEYHVMGDNGERARQALIGVTQ